MLKSIYIYSANVHSLVVAGITKGFSYEETIFLDAHISKGFLTFENIKESRNFHIAFGIGNNQIRTNFIKSERK